MSSPLTVKRRKIDDTAKTARKPFVSPLKNASATATPPKTKNERHNAKPYLPSALAHTNIAGSELVVPSPKVRPTASTQKRPTLLRPVRSATALRNPAELAAQRAITALELEIKTVRNEIDTLTQATRLNLSNTDADLEELAEKWRSATQLAAEEVFGTVKEKVCRMGGVQAWRDSERSRSEKQMEWQTGDQAKEDDDADCKYDENGDDLPEDEVTWRKAEKARVRQEMRDAMEEAIPERDEPTEVVKPVWQEEGKDDDTFTMDMMLRTLGIDLDKIGWDRDAQRWVR